MAAAFVQSQILNQSTNVTSFVLPAMTGITAGHTLLAFIVLADSTGIAVGTDTGSNSFGTRTLYTSASHDAAYWIANSASGTNTTLTLTCTNATFGFAGILELSGLLASPFDVDGGNDTVTVATTTWTFSQVTTTVSGDIVVAFGFNGTNNQTYTAGTGYTIPATNGQAAGGNQSGFVEYQVVGAAGNYTPTATISVSATAGNGVTVALKAAPTIVTTALSTPIFRLQYPPWR